MGYELDGDTPEGVGVRDLVLVGEGVACSNESVGAFGGSVVVGEHTGEVLYPGECIVVSVEVTASGLDFVPYAEVDVCGVDGGEASSQVLEVHPQGVALLGQEVEGGGDGRVYASTSSSVFNDEAIRSVACGVAQVLESDKQRVVPEGGGESPGGDGVAVEPGDGHVGDGDVQDGGIGACSVLV